MMHYNRLKLARFALLFGWAASGSLLAQGPDTGQPGGRFAAIEAINASYDKQLHDLECRRIVDLAALAEKAPAQEADAAYSQLFSLAIAQNLCPEAMAAAARCLATNPSGRETRVMAAFVQVLGRTQKGEHDRALADLKTFFHRPSAAEGSAVAPDSELALTVGEAFLQRLIHDGRYDIARKLCDLACAAEAPATLKEHFRDRMARLDLVGKPAPPIASKDVDDKPLSLAELKGKVVLVDFWATWCPPCVASIPALNTLAQKYQDRGFVILGVNVDAMHEDVEDEKSALNAVRRFLVRYRVTWVNLLNGKGSADFAAAYGVEQIPANFLISRDGTIVALEQSGESLERAVVRALEAQQESRRR